VLARLGLMLAVGAMMAGGVLREGARGGLGTIVRLAWVWLRRALGVVLALLVLFAEWGWRPLAALLGQLRRLALVARLENWVQTLPPYGALAAFLIPSLFLLPLKILALYFIAHGQKLAALGLLAVAKLGGTALVARLFILTGPQLMRIPWFARLHDRIMPWKDAVYAQIRTSWAWRYGRMLKSKTKQAWRRAWKEWRPAIGRLVSLARFQLRTLLRRGAG
jgi:hypothetical protein